MRNHSFALCFLLFNTWSIHVSGDSDKLPSEVKSLICTYEAGKTASWNSGDLAITDSSLDTSVTFDNIDLSKGTARLITDSGAWNIKANASLESVYFIAETPLGMAFTSVFSLRDKDGRFISVTSRHSDIRLELILSQHYGSCKVLE